jgi:hypothetical protein
MLQDPGKWSDTYKILVYCWSSQCAHFSTFVCAARMCLECQWSQCSALKTLKATWSRPFSCSCRNSSTTKMGLRCVLLRGFLLTASSKLGSCAQRGHFRVCRVLLIGSDLLCGCRMRYLLTFGCIAGC